MDIPSRIQRRGFRKWYERELLRGHSHLVLLILCALAMAGGLEALGRHIGGQRLLTAACLLVAAGIGAWALRRYLFLLMRAELIANQAVCGKCSAYARWQVEPPAHRPARAARAARPADAAPASMRVCCNTCGHRWPIEW